MEWLQHISEAIADRQADVATLPDGVKNWVAFMRILFFSGVIFIPWWRAPRYVVLAMVLTAVVIIAAKLVIPDFDTIIVGTIAQLVLWTPPLIYFFATWRTITLPTLKSKKVFSIIFAIWAVLVMVTMSISQILNAIGFTKYLMA